MLPILALAAVVAFTVGVLPADVTAAETAPSRAADLLLSSIDSRIPIEDEEVNDLLHTTGDVRFAPTVDAFVDTVLDEQWLQIDRDGVPIQGRTSQDLASLLVEASFGRSDPAECWDDDPPELISIAGAVYQAHDDGKVIQAVDEFVDAGAAERFINVVALGVAEEREDELGAVLWETPIYADGTLVCFWLEDGSSHLSRCQTIPNCFTSDTYLIASLDRWVVRFVAYFLEVFNSDELEAAAKSVLASAAG